MRATEVIPDHINEATIDGVIIRKGTVAAFLINARTINDPHSTLDDRQSAFHDIEEAIPALNALGLFEILEVRSPQIRSFVDQRMSGSSEIDCQ